MSLLSRQGFPMHVLGPRTTLYKNHSWPFKIHEMLDEIASIPFVVVALSLKSLPLVKTVYRSGRRRLRVCNSAAEAHYVTYYLAATLSLGTPESDMCEHSLFSISAGVLMNMKTSHKYLSFHTEMFKLCMDHVEVIVFMEISHILRSVHFPT